MKVGRIPAAVIDAVLFLGALGAVVGLFRFWNASLYASGRDPLRYLDQSLFAFFCPFAMFDLVAAGFTIAMLVRLVWLAKANRMLGISLRLSLLAVVIAIPCSGVRMPDFKGDHPFLRGFADWVREEADVAALHRWLVQQLATPGAADVDVRQVPREAWPAAAAKLSPSMVPIDRRSGAAELVLLWGGGFGHWGLAVREQPGWKRSEGHYQTRDLDERAYVWMDN